MRLRPLRGDASRSGEPLLSIESEFSERYKQAIERARVLSRSLAGPSLAEKLARLPPSRRAELLGKLRPEARRELAWNWKFWARPKQRPANLPDHFILLFLMGRGYGKTRSAAERVRDRIYAGAKSIGIIAADVDDAEQYQLGHGSTSAADSGLLNVFPPHHRPIYVKSDQIVRFHTGAIGYVRSALVPEYRGPNLDTAWLEEFAKWPKAEAIFPNIQMAVRKVIPGLPVEIIITTTPKKRRNLKEIVARPDCVTLLGSMYENAANTSSVWRDSLKSTYGGTRLAKQELGDEDGDFAEILEDDPDALFPQEEIDRYRYHGNDPDLDRSCVAIDPAISTGPRNDKTGIIGVGEDDMRDQFPLWDKSGKHEPKVWGKIAIDALDPTDNRPGAEAIVAERNRGGDLVESNIRACAERKRGTVFADSVKIVIVHATTSKGTRADPVSTLLKRGKIHFCDGLTELEDQCSEFDPQRKGRSPNGMDALVWASYYLGDLSPRDDAKTPDNAPAMKDLDGFAEIVSNRREDFSIDMLETMSGLVDPWGEKL